MKTFNLPDLGEGLADAEIREWFVKEGDTVKLDQPLVCMETAKAVVEVPSPQAGKITKLHGKAGDVINTGAPLLEFEGTETDARKDGGTVVGSLEETSQRLDEGEVIIGSTKQKTASNIKAMPAVRALAKQLNVDLNTVKASGPQGQIIADDVKRTAQQHAPTTGGEALHGVRRAMAMAMTHSHNEVVPVTLFEDADITHVTAKTDLTVALINAICAGIKAEPALNAWYDGKAMQRRLFQEINIGLAMDTPEGLFVPVLKNVESQDGKTLRTNIDTYKKTVKARTVAPSDLQGATISLSNFGMIAGKYATPIIVPPMVAIIACGKIREEARVYQNQIAVRKIMPISLSFDHRAVTGGEATRFLGALLESLEKG